jgi:hypothetical protein
MLAYVLADASLTRNEQMRALRRSGHMAAARRPMGCHAT